MKKDDKSKVQEKPKKLAKRLLVEVKEMEKMWHSQVNLRLQTLEQIKEEERQEELIKIQLMEKKDELRKLLEGTGNKSFEGLKKA